MPRRKLQVVSPKGIGRSHYFYAAGLLPHLVQGLLAIFVFSDGEAVLVHPPSKAYVRANGAIKNRTFWGLRKHGLIEIPFGKYYSITIRTKGP